MPASIKIALNPGIGTSSIIIDGNDLSKDVVAIQIGRAAGDADSLVHLQLRANVDIEGEVGQILAVQPATRPEDALQELLSGVDPGELEVEAMSRLGGLEGGPETPVQAILEVLRDWAKQA